MEFFMDAVIRSLVSEFNSMDFFIDMVRRSHVHHVCAPMKTKDGFTSMDFFMNVVRRSLVNPGFLSSTPWIFS